VHKNVLTLMRDLRSTSFYHPCITDISTGFSGTEITSFLDSHSSDKITSVAHSTVISSKF